MFELTRAQAKTLQEIAAKPDGRPEAYYAASGGRGRVVRDLVRVGLITRKEQVVPGGGVMHRFVATDAGKEAAAGLMNDKTKEK